MNKKKKSALAAVLLCASLAPFAGADAAEQGRVVWVLSGSAEENGQAKIVMVGDPLPAERPVTRAETVSRETVSGEESVLPAEKPAPVLAEETTGEPALSGEIFSEEPARNVSYNRPPVEEMIARSKNAAKKSGKKKKKDGEAAVSTISEENPLIVEADRMSYNNVTGDVEAEGRVDMRHMQDRYETELVYGNSQTQHYTAPGPVKWTSPTGVTNADSAEYDGMTGIGYFQNVHGWSDGLYYFQGETGVYDRVAGQAVVQKGYFTTKHAMAKTPDYRIEADSIDIYPNDHYLAHNVSLFVKDHRWITLSSYRGSLKHGVSLWSLIPRPSYESKNGIGLRSAIQVPLGNPENDLSFYMRLRWYSKAGFKPDIGFEWETWPGTFRLRYAKDESDLNDDHVWVEKKPSLSFNSRHFYIPHTDFYVGARGELAHWTEDWNRRHVSGSHKLWDVYLSHTPITLGPHLTFHWRLGHLRDYYGYNNSIRKNSYYSVGLNGNLGILSSWINYTNNNQQGRTPYSFDTYDMDKPVNTGFRVQLTRMDAVGVSYSIDTAHGRLEHRDFTYYRDMHSFYGWIRYRDIDKETEIMIQPKDFSF